MTREEIIRMAREAGFSVTWPETVPNFERFAALVNEYMPPKRDERRTFNGWWNDGEVSPGNNPYRHESAAYWAWEGWQAGTKAERETCAVWAELVAREMDDTNGTSTYIAKGIRARGQE